MSGPTTGRPGVRRLVVLVLTCLLVVAGVVAGVAVLAIRRSSGGYQQ